jgi:hypothetical protein
MRTISKFFLGIFLIFSIAFLTVATSAFFALTKPALYKNTIEESNTYSELTSVIPELIAADLSEELNLKLENEYGLTFDESILQENFIPFVKEEADKVISEEQIRSTFENNVDFFADYVKGKDEELFIYVPKEYIKTTLKEEFPKAYLRVTDEILSIETCTDLVLNNLSAGDKISCIPKDIKAELENEERDDLFISEFKRVFDEVAEDSFLGGQDKVLLSEFVAEVNKDLEAGDKIEYNQNDIDEIQDGYKLIKYGLIVAWIIIGIGLILLMMLSQKRHVKNIFILTPIFLVAGMLTLIPVIVTYVGFGYINDDIRSEIYEDFSNDPNTEEIGKLIYRIVENFSMNFMETLLFGALLVLGIGIVLALIWIAMPNGSKKPKVENSKTETEPSTEPMVN